MPELDRRLQEVSQLRKVWRGFREPQERTEDLRLAAALLLESDRLPEVADPLAIYGRSAVRAAIREWWCAQDYQHILQLARRLPPEFFETEPILRLYFHAAKDRTPLSF
jgi:hypothetical protein